MKAIKDRTSEISAALTVFSKRGSRPLTAIDKQLLRKFGYIEWDTATREWTMTDHGRERLAEVKTTTTTPRHYGQCASHRCVAAGTHLARHGAYRGLALCDRHHEGR